MTRLMSYENKNTVFLFFTACIVGSLNVLFHADYSISMILIAFELITLLWFLIKKDITSYLGFYLIFLCLSFEFDALVGSEVFYGFKEFRIFGINLGIIALLPVFFLCLKRGVRYRYIRETFNRFFVVSNLFFVLSFLGFIMGVMQISLNDNNIQSMAGIMGLFIGAVYTMVAIPVLIIFSFYYLLSWEGEKIQHLTVFLKAVLVGVVFSMLVSLATGVYGRYGGVDTLLVSNVVRFVPFMLFFPFYPESRNTKWSAFFLLCGVLAAFFTLSFNATGKMILLYIFAPLVIIIILCYHKRWLTLVTGVFLLVVLFSAFVVFSPAISLNANQLFMAKLEEVIGLIKFWEPGWLEKMPISPRVRILEFLNILYEYFEKPWFFFTGKGYMGTMIDHTGGLVSGPFILGAYSEDQWSSGLIYGVHESLNKLFLYNGLSGFLFYGYMLKDILLNFFRTPWLLIGGFWFLMVYGFSVTMSAFGATSLLLGYIYIEQMDGEKK
jgi:hypothetical protein